MKQFAAHALLQKARSLTNGGSLVFESKRSPVEYRLAAVDQFRKTILEFQKLCADAELPMASLHAKQLYESTVSPVREQLDTTGAERIAQSLCITLENELSLRAFFAVSPERAKYYTADAVPFGEAVARAFPSTTFDASEANRCLALGRSTACVFHLMRVMEIGLRVLAHRFSIPSDHTNWHNIIEGIEKAVRNLGADPATRTADWKDQQEFFSQAASYFMITKDAWRNYTAHARGKYTDEEAETLMISVRAFAQKLSTRLQE